jgi:cytochrome c-type biogenesis protein CcmH
MKKILKSRITHYALLIAFLAAFIFALPAFAQEPTPTDDEVNAIAKKLYCPVCENTPLDVCPTQACKEWRELIRQMLAEGRTEDEIIQHFVDQYGARVVAEPPREGFFWLAYILPPVIIALGAFILFRALRAWTRPVAAAPVSGSAKEAGGDDYAARFEEELKKRK